MVGRTRFIGDVIYSIGVSGFIYPIFGHWCWGPDGFLATMGQKGTFLEGLGMNFHDFAGSTVVHSIGGWVAIAGMPFVWDHGWVGSSNGMVADPCCRTI